MMDDERWAELQQAEDMAYFKADLCCYSPESYSLDEKKEICNDMISTSKAVLDAMRADFEQKCNSLHFCSNLDFMGGVPRGKDAEYFQKYSDANRRGDRRQVKMCLSKRSYFSVAEAERTIQYREIASGKALRWYTCPYCGLYHITSQQMAPMPEAA